MPATMSAEPGISPRQQRDARVTPEQKRLGVATVLAILAVLVFMQTPLWSTVNVVLICLGVWQAGTILERALRPLLRRYVYPD